MSFSTMSNSTVQYLSSVTAGGVICQYQYSPKDVISSSGDSSDLPVETERSSEKASEGFTGHTIHAICWRGHSRTLNVMCGKTGMTLGIFSSLIIYQFILDIYIYIYILSCRNQHNQTSACVSWGFETKDCRAEV